jgi:hypothetical protein
LFTAAGAQRAAFWEKSNGFAGSASLLLHAHNEAAVISKKIPEKNLLCSAVSVKPMNDFNVV